MKPTTQDILELARLDAIGMLEEDERVAFERAFQEASPALKAQIRREQSRLTDIGDLLPEVDTPPHLRERVLSAVRGAMGAVAGRNSDVLARIEPLAVNMRRNVSPLWRAACIGFATATVVLMGVAFTMQSTFDESLQAFRDGDLAQQIAEKIGPRFVDTLLSPSADRVNFTPVADDAGKSGAVLLIDRDSNLAFLVCKDLPRIDGQYALVVTDAEGKSIKTIARFETAGELNGRPIEGDVAPGMQLAIFAENSPRDAKPVLVSL